MMSHSFTVSNDAQGPSSKGLDMSSRSYLLVAVGLVLSGCYHATIETGAKPSNVTVRHQWASGWIYGLVPPKTVETAAKCTTGVSRVETQQSFVNGLVGILTLGIYTPMEIGVTCAEGAAAEAAGATSLLVPDSASAATWQAAIQEAAAKSEAEGRPVYVQVVE
jgi:Bor protein